MGFFLLNYLNYNNRIGNTWWLVDVVVLQLGLVEGDKVSLVDLEGASGPTKVWEAQHTVRGKHINGISHVSQTAVRIRYLLLLSIDVTHRGGFCGDAWPKDLTWSRRSENSINLENC